MTDSRGDGLTLMAVHAHPDDEATSTGGVFAKYGAEGVRTVLVTCTNGELGDGPGGSKPEDDGHDEAVVVEHRRRELAESCRVLGIDHLEMLGYRDSGMMGWATNDDPRCFWAMDVTEAARPLAALMRAYRPDVVVTYDDYGFYGHPDHIQAHRITVAALDMAESPAELYFPTFRRSLMPEFARRMAEMGIEVPDIDEERFGSPDEAISAAIDCRSVGETKLAAVRAHASQSDTLMLLRWPVDAFVDTFGIETFIRARGADTGPMPADDLFVNLRARA